jgi:N-methylhydantoinase B
MATSQRSLNPVTFEVLKNAFVTVVDEMAEQILRTCHSFVIYSRDFSCALCDANGDTVMQGSQDIAVHVGTLHLKAKAVLEDFEDDIHEGDVFAVNDPYRGGTHFPDVSLIRPVFTNGEMIALAQANGHWADVGGSVPGSFDVGATDHFGEGVRIPPVRVVARGETRDDVIAMIASNSRSPDDIIGDCHAQIEATRIAESELFRLIDKYGKDTVVAAFGEVQDYVEGLTRARIAELEDGSWETVDYLDSDPGSDEGLVAVRLKLTISGDEVHYDLSGSDPAIASFLNAGAGVQDLPARDPLELRLLSGDHRGRRPRGQRRQRRLADGRHRLGLRSLRKDHERRFRAVVAGHARAGDGLLLQPRVPAGRRARRTKRRPALLHVV